VTLLERPAGLRPHERALLEELFGEGAAPGASAPLAARMQRLMNHWRRFSEPVRAELRQAGWLDDERLRRRGVWTTGGVLLMIGAVALLLAAALLNNVFGAGVFATPLALFLLGLFVVILGQGISPLSDSGREIASGWKQFGGYLTQVTRGREAVTRPDLFERYLAYAAGLGLAEGWLRFFRKQGEMAIPAWFQPLADDGGASFMAMIASSSASTGAGAGAAGAGAAGGGASGTG
jgi:uncharacterized membrane protein